MIHLPLVLTDQADPGREAWDSSLGRPGYNVRHYETLNGGRIQNFPGKALQIVSIMVH